MSQSSARGSSGVGTAAGDLSGTYPNPTVAKLQGNTVNAAVLGSNHDGYTLQWVNGSSNWAATKYAGDVTGSASASTVAKIQGNAISSTALGAVNDGYILQWINGSSNWSATKYAGDVTGSASASTVAKIQGNAVISTSLTSTQDGYLLTWVNSSSQWQAKPATAAAGGLSAPVTSTTITKTTDYVITSSDYIILCNHSAALLLTLPAHSAGRTYVIKDISGNASTNNITVARNGGTGNIEGIAASKVFSTNYGGWTLFSDGSAWWVY